MIRATSLTIPLLVLFGTVGCRAPAPHAAFPPAVDASAVVDLAAEYREIEAQGAEVFTVDAAASSVRLFVYRGGKAARAGHNHVIDAARTAQSIQHPLDHRPAAERDHRFEPAAYEFI